MKKKEKLLLKELQHIQKNDPNNEKKMHELIKKAISFFSDELHPKLADFYFEYGNILVSILEQQDEEENNQQLLTQQDQNNSLPQMVQVDVNKEKDKNFQQENYVMLKQHLKILKLLDQLQEIIQQHQILNYKNCKNKLKAPNSKQMIFIISYLKHLKELGIFNNGRNQNQCISRREEWQDSLQHYEQSLEIMKKQHSDPKIIAEIYYKIGNVQLLENEPGCEQKALFNFQQSFQICYEQSHQQKISLDPLNNIKSIQKLKKQINTKDEGTNMLLLMLLEKIEDTLVQQKESSECKNEIEKWKNTQSLFEEPNVSQGQLSHSFDQIKYPKKVINLGTIGSNQTEQRIGNIIIKRIKKDF